MKEFTVTIDRTVHQLRTVAIKAESEKEAYNMAVKVASEKNGEWDGTEYDTTYKINLEEVPNNYIDRYGNPYDSESENCWPAGGGLHKDCEFNADALYAYYTMGDRDKITAYLTSKGFTPLTQADDYEEWIKGNTQIVYECYDNGAHLWGYMHTELIDTE